MWVVASRVYPDDPPLPRTKRDDAATGAGLARWLELELVRRV